MLNMTDILNEIKKYTNIKSFKYEYSFIKNERIGYKAYYENDKVVIEYSNVHYLLKALSEIEAGVIKLPYENKLLFNRFGITLDCARNAVPSIDGLKRTIVLLSLFGYSYLGLYLEDCFEVDDEPYFGYNRGRYTKDELKEIVEYGNMFGIEVIPYIQTLAHLRQIFNNWDPYYRDCRDTNDILLMGSERTYQLIENMIKTCRECFTTDKIHIGMDEAFMMTYGRYRFDNKDYDRADVFMKHTKRVVDICKKYDFKPEAWGDMFISELTKETMIDGLTLTAWSYTETNEKVYFDYIKKHKELTDKVSFAGGVCKWYGYTPLNELSVLALEASIKASKGMVDDYLVTTWGDDGAECSYNSIWYSFIKASNMAYSKKLNDSKLSKISKLVTGYKMDELLAFDLANKVFDCPMLKPINISKYVFYQDIFYGISDRQDNPKWIPYFEKNIETLRKLSKKDGLFKIQYKEQLLLTQALKEKCDLRRTLVKAYKEKDIETLKVVVARLENLYKLTVKFHEMKEAVWHFDNKPQGYEVLDIRLSGVASRIKYSIKVINDYLNKKTDKIELLEYKDLSPEPVEDEYNGAMAYSNYEQNVTQGVLCWKNSQ